MIKRQKAESAGRIVAETAAKRAASRRLWNGLNRYNRKAAGRFNYSRTVLTVRSTGGRVLGGLILQSYWKESYVELPR